MQRGIGRIVVERVDRVAQLAPWLAHQVFGVDVVVVIGCERGFVRREHQLVEQREVAVGPQAGEQLDARVLSRWRGGCR